MGQPEATGLALLVVATLFIIAGRIAKFINFKK